MVNMKITIDEIRKKFINLINDAESREDIANFAARAIEADDNGSLEIEEDIDDKIWKSIIYLSGVDLLEGPNDYLHSKENFIDAMREIGL